MKGLAVTLAVIGRAVEGSLRKPLIEQIDVAQLAAAIEEIRQAQAPVEIAPPPKRGFFGR